MQTMFAVQTVTGKVRKQNQDNFYLNGKIKQICSQDALMEGGSVETDQLFAVCDGMGGEESGEVASFLAVKTLKEYPREQFFGRWDTYVATANNAICKYRKEKNIRMGTTFAGVAFCGSRVIAVNLGDTRIYRIRAGKAEQLSRDHTEFQLMVDAGILQKEDFAKTPGHNYLTQHLGIYERDMELEPYTAMPGPAMAGDIYLVCSDGLYGVVPDEEITGIAALADTPQICCEQLIHRAEQNRSKDNITALVIFVNDEQ